MPKHRSTVYTVVREKAVDSFDDDIKVWEFDALVGTYFSIGRADEVAAATIQHYVDAGMSVDDPEYRCTVKPSTWYEE